MLHLIVVRMRCAVRSKKPIKTKRSVIWFIAEITAISPEFLAVFFLQNTLIHPVPDSSSTDTAIGIDHIPVFLKITHRVSHCVGIFSHNERTVSHLACLFCELFWSKITIVIYIALCAVCIAEWKGYSVECHHSIAHRLQVRTYPTLIAKTPEHNARMVLVTLYQTNSTVNVRLAPFGIFSHHLVGIAVAV